MDGGHIVFADFVDISCFTQSEIIIAGVSALPAIVCLTPASFCTKCLCIKLNVKYIGLHTPDDIKLLPLPASDIHETNAYVTAD